MPDSARDGSARRDLGRGPDRLTIRVALGSALIVIGFLSAGFYALSRHHVARTVVIERRAAELQGRLLEVALRHQMMEQDTSLMTEVLGEVGSQPSVRSAMILNHSGEIRISSDPERIGERIPLDSPTCFVCHSKDSKDRERWVLLGEGDEKLLRTVLPIENRADCWACHDRADEFNGMLVLDTSMSELRAQHRQDVAWFLGSTVLLGLFLLGGVGLLIRWLVLVRLEQLGRAARTIAAGNLSERAPVRGDDVITTLSRDFSDMAETVSRLVADVRARESQLANIMNSLDDGLVVLDDESHVVASNLSFCRRLGSHPEAIQGFRCHRATEGQLPCCTSGSECPASRCMAT